ncbi:MAG: NYN domain-containing protein [Zoogloeaceae bacterium]|jgi:uncharacterized LabA/DUF88 family protein|nr:NYN domain-containing protein [Zoogloeaceae bacterium]
MTFFQSQRNKKEMTSPGLGAKTASEESNMRLAVLIDADNASANCIEAILSEITRFGEATVKRIYGDFTSPYLAAWKGFLHVNAIKPVQQYAYTTGKNATDSAMIIDAMDLLYTRRFDGFCLITSDSDFTSLAIRIREEGLTVLGFGEEKTPSAFIKACHKFIFTEVLQSTPPATESIPDETASEPQKTKNNVARSKKTESPSPKKPLPLGLISNALEQSSDDTGWADLGAFGNHLTKLRSDFDPRLYGFAKLSSLVKANPRIFEVEERTIKNSSRKEIFIRAKQPHK